MRTLGWLCAILGMLLVSVFVVFSLVFQSADRIVLRDPSGILRAELTEWPDGSPSLILYARDGVIGRAGLPTAVLIAGFGILILALRPPVRPPTEDSRTVEKGAAEVPLEQFVSGLGGLIERYAKEIREISDKALVKNPNLSADEFRDKIVDAQKRCYRQALELYYHLVGVAGEMEEELLTKLTRIKETRERAAVLKQAIESMVKPIAD